MPKVWVIEYCDYDDHAVVAVVATEELARERVIKLNEADKRMQYHSYSGPYEIEGEDA